MPLENPLSPSILLSFLLVLSRIGSVFVLVPLPWGKNAPDLPKIVFSLAVTVALIPFWPVLPSVIPGFGETALWLIQEICFGTTVGLAISFLSESFVMGAQLIGLQAGYSYASTIDPTSQSDSTVLQMMVQLFAALLFLVLGLDRHVLRILAESLTVYPPGSFVLDGSIVMGMVKLGGAMFATGVKLALPVMALLLLADVSLALLGRMHAQLQLLSMAFPAKMLLSLVALASVGALFPVVYEKAAAQTVSQLTGLLGK